MTIHEFTHQIFAIANASSLCGAPVIRRITSTTVNLRIPAASKQFIDVFYNELSGRTAFALIEGEQRIFGADNTGYWHIHPFDDPDRHEPVNSPVLFSDFIRMIEQYS